MHLTKICSKKGQRQTYSPQVQIGILNAWSPGQLPRFSLKTVKPPTGATESEALGGQSGHLCFSPPRDLGGLLRGPVRSGLLAPSQVCISSMCPPEFLVWESTEISTGEGRAFQLSTSQVHGLEKREHKLKQNCSLRPDSGKEAQAWGPGDASPRNANKTGLTHSSFQRDHGGPRCLPAWKLGTRPICPDPIPPS